MRIDADTALVLLELLARRGERGEALRIDCSAKTVALDRVECALEARLTEPFDPDYRALLGAARQPLAAG